ncbi:hypothetical protein ACLI09_04145 [Flavobacterium sp. RHBU_24]|uniref:hypothetical protein n=1 Tax=Flavobacterium sp. RHBU_24 TaxID=3391185 RepID=UPI003984889B
MIKGTLFAIAVLTVISCNKKEAASVPEKNDTVSVQVQQPEQLHEHIKPEPQMGESVGRIGDMDIVYDFYNITQSATEKFVVYIKQDKVKDTLLTLTEDDGLGDNYVIGAEVLTVVGKPFIYVRTGHTYGHSRNYLYSFDVEKKKACRVEEEPLSVSYKVPDSLFTGHVTSFDLEKNDDNTFYSGVNLHSPQMVAYTFSNQYKLVEKANRQYILKPYGDKLVDENGNVIKIR